MIRRIIFLFLPALLCSCGKPEQPTMPGRPVERIISLAPNITETIYALGLGEKLVGNTTYCTYPETARTLPRVGGFGQFNYEAIVALHPDLVILHKEYDAEKVRLKSLGIPFLETSSYFIVDILETIQRIGKVCDVQEQTGELVAQLERRITELRATTLEHPRVLITFGIDEPGTIQAFGSECLHNELLEIAGGENVVKGRLPFATLSREAILRLNPDIIIVLAPELEPTNNASDSWSSFPSVNAVRNNRVHTLTDDHTCIPGPRFIQTLETFVKIIGQP